MRRDRLKWNERYRRKPPVSDPTPFVARHWRQATVGRALDIAAGDGRNALFLARRGFRVDAVDISDVAMGGLAGRHPRLRPVCADLERFDLPRDTYTLIVNTRFLLRRLFPQIREALLPGGMLLFESYRFDPLRAKQHHFPREYLLRENELLQAFLTLSIRFYQEVESEDPHAPGPIASLVAVRK
jgi:SAM-dependent methyltransferase